MSGIVERLVALVKDRPALAVGALLVIVMVGGLLAAMKPPKPAVTTQFYTNQPYQPVVSFVRNVPPVMRSGLENIAPTNGLAAIKPIPAVSIHVDLPPEPPPLSIYAPFGRLIRCQLVITVESGASDTPIIGLVTDDVYHAGKLVIPVHSEVHGRAQVDVLRDRIISSGTWTIVKQSGEELLVNGVVLDRQDSGESGTAGVTDGSVGLSGQVIRSQSAEEIKLFASTFLSGVASGLEQQQTTVLGTQISGTARNAGLNGTAQVLNAYAQQIADAIKKQGVFVRVPAG